MCRFAAILVTTLTLSSLTSVADACSRVLWTTKQTAEFKPNTPFTFQSP